MIELFRPLTPELARRWLAALLLVPQEERRAVVASVERSIAGTYAGSSPIAEPIRASTRFDPLPAPPNASGYDEEHEVHVVYPAQQHAGFVEQVVKTYAVGDHKPGARSKGGAQRSRHG